ncbi:MAG TPA: hypothetical protein ENN39_04855 [Desulfonatronum sp.]|nr:hypothetical protein [Desulfonatronum sp.]
MIVRIAAFCRWLTFTLLAWAVFFFSDPARVLSEQAGEESFLGTATELPVWLQTPDGYVYRPKDKPDPFRPFIRQVPEEETFRPLAPQRPLTPLERVEVSQLKVVGIMRQGRHHKSALAMVEMPDGKGYVLRPGVTVGRYGGVVDRITTNEVVVLEQGHDITGREQTREIVLKLQPSQGEARD